MPLYKEFPYILVYSLKRKWKEIQRWKVIYILCRWCYTTVWLAGCSFLDFANHIYLHKNILTLFLIQFLLLFLYNDRYTTMMMLANIHDVDSEKVVCRLHFIEKLSRLRHTYPYNKTKQCTILHIGTVRM